MCLVTFSETRELVVEIALEDIEVYKTYYYNSKSKKFGTVYQNFEYDKGELPKVDFLFCEPSRLDGKSSFKFQHQIHQGYHSFTNLEDCFRHTNSLKLRHPYREGIEVSVICIIPKDSKIIKGYFDHKEGIVSNNLIIKKIIE